MRPPRALAALILAAGAMPALAQLPSGNWGLRFADEFTGQGGAAGTNLDMVKWNVAYPWGRTHNYPAYIRDDNITVSGGTLNLKAKRESFGGQPFTSGAINTDGRFNFTNGYIEARMKLPGFLGAWPAFWLLQNGWPPELDVMEAHYRSDYDGDYDLGYGDMYQYIGTYHWGPSWDNKFSGGTGFKYTGQNLTAAYHNYGTLWATDHVTFFFDGQNMGSLWAPQADIAQMRNMYLIFNLGVGGWPGDPPSWEGLGPAFQTDWVRVWQGAPGTAQSNWTKVAGGNQNWDDAANWSAGVPQLSSQTAFLGPVSATDVRLDWAGNKVLGQLTFQAATNYNVGWADDSLMLAAASGQSRAYVNGYNQSGQGRMSISSRVELYSDVSVRNYLSNPITFNGAIIGTGELSTEQGKVVLNGPGTYTGATRVRFGGDLTVNGAIAATSNLLVHNGVATIATTGALTSTAHISIGVAAGESGTLDLQGNAQLTAQTDLNVGDVSATGRLNIAGNAQVKAKTLAVGKFGNANGAVVQTGGAVTSLAAPGDWRIGGYNAAAAAAVGTYAMQGGSINTAANLHVGAYGRGTMTQTGGTVTDTGVLSIGRFAGGVGTYDLSIGNGVVTAHAQPFLIVGEQGAGTLLVGGNSTVNAATLALGHAGGTGTVTQTGGTVNATTGVALGNATGGAGTYTLSGGVLRTSKVARGAGGSTFNFNGGTLRASESSVTFLQGLSAANVQAGGARIDSNGFAVTVAQSLTGAGGLTKTGFGTLRLTGNNNYAGATTVQQGSLIVNGTLPAGGVTVAAGATLGGSGNVGGAIDLSGELSPGNSPGTLRAASAHFRAGSTYTVEIASPSIYDRVTLTGAATIDEGAVLDVELPGGYLPRGGESFDIVTFAAGSGRFSSYDGVELSNGLILAPFYREDSLRLIATLPGDLNGDGSVSLRDYQSLERNFGQPGTWQDGDFDFDGLVATSDLKLLLAHNGQSVAAPVAAPLIPQSVPEPGTGAVMIALAFRHLSRRRRATRA